MRVRSHSADSKVYLPSFQCICDGRAQPSTSSPPLRGILAASRTLSERSLVDA
jgi:hypothetical protein